MQKRFDFKCWQCQRQYSLYLEVPNDQVLIVACPFCNAEARVDLAPYKRAVKTIYRGDGKDAPTVGDEYDLPAVLPTAAP